MTQIAESIQMVKQVNTSLSLWRWNMILDSIQSLNFVLCPLRWIDSLHGTFKAFLLSQYHCTMHSLFIVFICIYFNIYIL